MTPAETLTIGQCATLACLLEVTAPKPGNVHRGADFEDMTLVDFVTSAVAIGPIMQRASTTPLGETILAAIRATRQLVDTNTNLGTVLLIAPLAKVPRADPLHDGIVDVLETLAEDDSRHVYEAIRLANPSGLGRQAEMDVADRPPARLLTAMQAAADRDLVARQYADRFQQVFDTAESMLTKRQAGSSLTATIIRTHLELMSRYPDSLIARKCGPEVANEAAARARAACESGGDDDGNYHRSLADLDFWLRSDGNRRNPGTTADIIAAALFVGLRDAAASLL